MKMKERTTSLWPLLVLMLVIASPWAHAQDVEAEPDAAPEESSEAATEEAQDDDEVLENLQGILQEESMDAYRYDAQGRRDPFRSLIGPSKQNIERGDAPPGVPGFLIDELDLQGIVRTSRGYVATAKGPDNLGYTLRAGDTLYDGEVLRVTADAVYFRQEVNDPTRIERQREVVKELERGSQARRP